MLRHKVSWLLYIGTICRPVSKHRKVMHIARLVKQAHVDLFHSELGDVLLLHRGLTWYIVQCGLALSDPVWLCPESKVTPGRPTPSLQDLPELINMWTHPEEDRVLLSSACGENHMWSWQVSITFQGVCNHCKGLSVVSKPVLGRNA